MLTVGVYLDGVAESSFTSAPQSSRDRPPLAEVPVKPDDLDIALGYVQLCNRLPRRLTAAVVDDDDGQPMVAQLTHDRAQNLVVIMGRDDGAKLLLHTDGRSIGT